VERLSQILRAASLVPTPGAAIDLVLQWVIDRCNADACALYARIPDAAAFRLIGSKGNRKASLLPVGQASRIVERREPVRSDRLEYGVADGKAAGAPDGRSNAYLGVPVIRFGKTTAVLEVLRTPLHGFSDEDAAVLLTLGAQIAGLLGDVEAGRPLALTGQQVFFGSPASPGVAIGTAVLPRPESGLDAIPDKSAPDVELEIEDFEAAVGSVRSEMKTCGSLLSARLPGDVLALYDVYAMLLDDGDFLAEITRRIRAGLWAPAALRDAVGAWTRRFEAMEDEYLRERGEDIRALGQRILLYLSSGLRNPGLYPERAVLVGEEVGLPRMNGISPERLSGLVCTRGSLLSHGVVVARALGIAAVVGVEDLPLGQCGGREIIVDGYRGRVILNPDAEVKAQFQRLASEEAALDDCLAGLQNAPARTRDGRHIPLEANIALLDEIPTAREQGAEGVGLYRSEMPFLLHDSLPGEEAQLAIYRELLEAFAPAPVTIRTLDAGSDKALPYLPAHETNPALGQRGIRLSLEYAGMFLVQLRAVLRANAGLGNLRLLLPMVTLPAELDEAKELIGQAIDDLRSGGISVPSPPIGVMLEVPAAVFRAAELAERADFVSIGSNDLTQYILAADRTNPHVTTLCDPMSPAVLEAIGMAVERAHTRNVPVGVCGEIAGDPLAALLLVGLGVDELSMSPRSIPRVKQVIRRFDTAQAHELWQRALACSDGARVRALLADALDAAGLGGLVRAGK